MSIIEELYNELKSNNRIVYFNSGRTELIVRCPYCGDSTKDRTHAHLYISTETPNGFFCQRCDTKGYLNSEFIKDIEINNDDLGRSVDTLFKQFKRNTNKLNKSYNFNTTKKLLIPKYDLDSSMFQEKVSYLSKRLGRELTDRKELFSYKLIGNFLDFLALNKLQHLLDNDKFYHLTKAIDKRAIGFLSQDSNFISFRMLDKNSKYRYLHLNLNYPYSIGSKAYCIRSSLPIMEPKIELILTEGIFDIISVKNNFYNNVDNSNRLFFAVNGKSFNQVPLMLNRLGFLNIDLHIYSDKDIPFYVYNDKLQLNKFDSIKISYNTFEGEKDFGVPMEKISRKTQKLK